MKVADLSKTSAPWSRWGECPQAASITISVAGVAATIVSSCARVPYSSSEPWIARIGQRIAGRERSMFQNLNRGSSQISFQPQNVRSTE